MLWPKVTELPRRLEPSIRDPFVQDLNAPTPPLPDPPPRPRRE